MTFKASGFVFFCVFFFYNLYNTTLALTFTCRFNQNTINKKRVLMSPDVSMASIIYNLKFYFNNNTKTQQNNTSNHETLQHKNNKHLKQQDDSNNIA